MAPKAVLVTGANGYIGNAVARAFVLAGWRTYGLIRSSRSSASIAVEEIIPIIGTVLDAIVSTTESLVNYESHFNNTIGFLRALSAATVAAGGSKPLVIFTSGCKDYENVPKIFEHTDVLRPVLVRPTNLYGRSSSYYGGFFILAAELAKSDKPMVMPSKPNAILNALHIDDCGEAYVALPSHSQQNLVDSQIFNISAHRYETVDEIGQALVSEYKIKGGLEYVNPQDWLPDGHSWLPMLVDFPQWTDSTKLRNVTGWHDRRPLFSETLDVYRKAFEAADLLGDPMVRKMKEQLQAFSESMTAARTWATAK